MKRNDILALALSIGVCLFAGIFGSIFTASEVPTWFVTLAKPSWSPPAWVFGPVWTTLYLLMGISAWMIWRKGWKRKDVKMALWVFAAQLVLNALWSLIFFGWHQLGWAFLEIILLWVTILMTIIFFAKISRPAAWLLAPYLAWVTLASILNFTIWQLNT
ncbi:tryptophan-rich sensory protein [Patescibacteria group bacterium]|jgi:tryptophan-rich sensory protein|nr:tryptophan-rich sensory protein [Patescibacteria group bacterium]